MDDLIRSLVEQCENLSKTLFAAKVWIGNFKILSWVQLIKNQFDFGSVFVALCQ